MADAKINVRRLKQPEVHENLIKGETFIRWDDDSAVGHACVLKVDSKGSILYWRGQDGKDCDCLELTVIKDVRTGRPARIPKDSKLKCSLDMGGGGDESLEDKSMTVVYGNNMVDVYFITFVSINAKIAKEWTNNLFPLCNNLLAINASPLVNVEVHYDKLMYKTMIDGKISVKDYTKLYCSHKDDKKRCTDALAAVGLPSSIKTDSINTSKLTFEDYLKFYFRLLNRHDVQKVFESLGAKKKPYLTCQQFVDFLNKDQRDPRLNEIIHPYVDMKRGQELLEKFEFNKEFSAKGQLSLDGFTRYLMSEENTVIPYETLDIYEDPNQPLSNYIINSSHNTYLTGHQLTGRSSVEIYRQVLLSGCRCIELDCWDGKGEDQEPIITHGFTMCTEIVFKDVMYAIAESAFKTSDYPVILSFENHCTTKQQQKLAFYCHTIFGEFLLNKVLDEYPLEVGKPLPPPSALYRKILIKNKKLKQDMIAIADKQPSADPPEYTQQHSVDSAAVSNENKKSQTATPRNQENDGNAEEDTDGDTDVEEEPQVNQQVVASNISSSGKEKKDKKKRNADQALCQELSDLVNYITPVRCPGFEKAEKLNRSWEMSSFVETTATNKLKEQPVEFVNYNKRQLTRIYPKGKRVDSSNYMPQVFWNAGCQLAALNFQTMDLAMQLNNGKFEFNGRCGYLLKPDFMRRKDRNFDPFAESTVDGIVAGKLSVKVISGQLLTERRVGTYVEIEMYGLPVDTVRKRYRTKMVSNNGINPYYDEEPFVFKKIVLPALATLRIAVNEENGKLIGQRVLPVEVLRPGYRQIQLRTESNMLLNMATLFVKIDVNDFVPDKYEDFAAALADPINYQSAFEKRSDQLAELMDEDDEQRTKSIAEDPSIATQKKSESLSKHSIVDDNKPKRAGSLPVSNKKSGINQSQTPTKRLSSEGNGTALLATALSAQIPLEQNYQLFEITDKKILSRQKLADEQELKAAIKKNEKSKITLEKVHNEILSKLSQSLPISGSNNEEIDKSKIKSHISWLENEQKQEMQKLLRCNIEKIYELKMKHLKIEQELKEKLLEKYNATSLKQLKQLHQKEEREAKKRSDTRSKEQIKTVSKNTDDKHELKSLKREIRRKMIDEAVSERQGLKNTQKKQESDLVEQFDKLREELSKERQEKENSIKKEFETQLQEITRGDG